MTHLPVQHHAMSPWQPARNLFRATVSPNEMHRMIKRKMSERERKKK